jgi:hypothetical protein
MATSKLQIAVGNMLDKTFPGFSVRENYRPDWLRSSDLTILELDFYIDELNIAFEVQGIQHVQYVPFFHGDYDGFLKRKQFDQEKKDLCYGAGIRLIEIFSLMDALVEIKTLEENIAPRPGAIIAVAPPREYKSNKPAKVKKDIAPKNPLEKYKRDRERFQKPVEATAKEKIKEIKQFRKKVRRFHEKGGKGLNKSLPYFRFKTLTLEEQNALLDEHEIKSKIDEYISA